MSFTEKNLVPNAGLLPAAVLAQRIGLGELIDQRLGLAQHGANSGAKALTVIGSMLAGGDSIDDTAVLRAGAAGELFDTTRAPSTIGSWLRAHKWSNVRQLDAVSRELLARLWAAGAGPGRPGRPVDDRPGLHDRAGLRPRQAGRGVRLHQGPWLPPAVRHLRRDRDGAVQPAAGRVGGCGPRREELPDRDGQPAPCRRRHRAAHDPRRQRASTAGPCSAPRSSSACEFSVTARQDKKIRAAIEAIEEAAWTPIPYWLSTPEVSGADVAETTYTAFSGKDAMHRAAGRAPGPPDPRQPAGPVHHLGLPRVRHQPARRHARDRGRPPPPRGRRAADRRAEERRPGAPAVGEVHGQRRLARARRDGPQPRPRRRVAWPARTSRRPPPAPCNGRVFTVPGRLVHSGRRRHLRLPASWPWASAITKR